MSGHDMLVGLERGGKGEDRADGRFYRFDADELSDLVQQLRIISHRRRLDRFVTVLGEELRGGRGGAYQVRDHYIARVFDVLELLRTATTAFR